MHDDFNKVNPVRTRAMTIGIGLITMLVPRNNEPNFYNDVSKSHDILIYPIEINSTIKGWKVSSNMFGDKSFLTKLSAIKFAINYMKKNPTPCEVEK